jgi:hypothetical protein
MNRRIDTDVPVPVSLEKNDSFRKRRAVSSGDDTVARLLGTNLISNYGVIDLDTAPVLEEHLSNNKSNVILPWGRLSNFICENLVCRKCFSPLNKSSLQKVQVTFATSVNFFCQNTECRKIGQLAAETTLRFHDGRANKELKKYATAHRASDYALNLKMILSCQQFGGGQAAASVLGGTLSIVENAFHNTWTKIEESVAKVQIEAGKVIIGENVEKEKSLSKTDDKGRYLFCVLIDAGWNNRGSGRAYNSDSGHHITVGNRTGLVVALHYMSKQCIKCEIGEKCNRQECIISDWTSHTQYRPKYVYTYIVYTTYDRDNYVANT